MCEYFVQVEMITHTWGGSVRTAMKRPKIPPVETIEAINLRGCVYLVIKYVMCLAAQIYAQWWSYCRCPYADRISPVDMSLGFSYMPHLL